MSKNQLSFPQKIKQYFHDPQKQIHTVTVGVKWMVIALIIFIAFQLFGMVIINHFFPGNESTQREYSKDYMGHWYCGTFFIEMKGVDHYGSIEAYQEMVDNEPQIIPQTVSTSVIIVAVTILLIGGYIFLRRLDRQEQLVRKTYILPIILGLSILIANIVAELGTISYPAYYAKTATSFLSTATYYPQLAYVAAIPAFLILLGLILWCYSGKVYARKTLKVVSWIVILIGTSFTLYRFGIRIYELPNVIANNGTVRLPFYNYMLELPRSMAINDSEYVKLVIFRFIKDLPLFTSALITMVYMQKILLSYADNNVDYDINRKRLWIIIISLAIASLWFNILGLFEINILHNGFVYPFQNATYSFGIRGRVEPLLYAFEFYALKVVLDANQKIIKRSI